MRIDLTRQAEAMCLHSKAFEIAQRGTGRTTMMINEVSDDDIIICAMFEHMHLQRELKIHGRRTDLKVMSPEDFPKVTVPPIAGDRRIHFSHGFIQQLIEHEVFATIKMLERRLNSVNADIDTKETERLKRVMLEDNPILRELTFEPMLPCRNSTPDHLL